MKVYLDDERTEPKGWVRTKTAQETIKLLKENNVVDISLDHDLGDFSNGTGYDVLLWIEEQVFTSDYKPPIIYIHTANPSARIKMTQGVNQIYNRVVKNVKRR